jgi:hypothetical protein
MVLEDAGEIRYRLHVPRSACAEAAVEIAAELPVPPGMMLPRRVDLYEEPYPGCEAGP